MSDTLFNIEDFTLESVKKIMKGKTCRKCANRLRHEYNKSFFYCKARHSNRTLCGFLKIKGNQPACILFEDIKNLNK